MLFRSKVPSRFYLEDLVTHTGDREIRSSGLSGRVGTSMIFLSYNRFRHWGGEHIYVRGKTTAIPVERQIGDYEIW